MPRAAVSKILSLRTSLARSPSLSCQVAPLPSPLCKVAAPTRALRAVAAQALNQEREEKLNLRKQLGKGPPKKGQGKRASKKK